MTKRLALSTALAVAMATGGAFAAGDMDRSAGAQSGGAYQSAAADSAAQGSESVRQIQQALQNEGYDVQVDGIYGPNTQQALEQFQQRHGSMAAGQSGMDSQQALTPDDRSTMSGQGGDLSPVDRPEAGNTATQNLGWDRAGGIREGAAGEPGSLGTGRGETGVGGGAGGGAGGGGAGGGSGR